MIYDQWGAWLIFGASFAAGVLSGTLGTMVSIVAEDYFLRNTPLEETTP